MSIRTWWAKRQHRKREKYAEKRGFASVEEMEKAAVDVPGPIAPLPYVASQQDDGPRH